MFLSLDWNSPFTHSIFDSATERKYIRIKKEVKVQKYRKFKFSGNECLEVCINMYL